MTELSTWQWKSRDIAATGPRQAVEECWSRQFSIATRQEAASATSQRDVSQYRTPSLSSPLQPPGIPGLQYSTNPLVGLLPAMSNAQHPLFACRLLKVHGCLTGISKCRYVVYFQSGRRGFRGATLATRGYPLLRLPADQALSTLPATVRAGRGAQPPAMPNWKALVRNAHRTT